MSTTTSVATTTGSTTAASTSACALSYEFPKDVKDVGCAAVAQGNITDAFDHCCKGDAPVKYNDDCNIYCLAQNQDLGDLRKCLISSGGAPNLVFCQPTNGNATATQAASTTAGSTGTSTSTSSSSTSSTTDNAATMNNPVSKTGLGLVAMVFCSTLMGFLA